MSLAPPGERYPLPTLTNGCRKRNSSGMKTRYVGEDVGEGEGGSFNSGGTYRENVEWMSHSLGGTLDRTS